MKQVVAFHLWLPLEVGVKDEVASCMEVVWLPDCGMRCPTQPALGSELVCKDHTHPKELKQKEKKLMLHTSATYGT